MNNDNTDAQPNAPMAGTILLGIASMYMIEKSIVRKLHHKWLTPKHIEKDHDNLLTLSNLPASTSHE